MNTIGKFIQVIKKYLQVSKLFGHHPTRKRLTKIFHVLLIFILISVWNFSSLPQIWDNPPIPPEIQEAKAAAGDVDIGRWTDTTTTLIPTETWASPNSLFSTQARNDNSTYTFTDSTASVDIGTVDADGYLISVSFEFEDTSNGRFNPQGKIVQTSGTGTFVSAFTSGYDRDTSEDRAFVRTWAFVDGPSVGADFQFQWKRDVDAPTGGTVTSSFDIIPLYYADIGIYSSTNASLYGGTTPNVVTGFTGTDGTNITRSGDVITVTGDNRRYLVLGSWFLEGFGTRTQRIGGFDIDGSQLLPAQGYAYARDASNDEVGAMMTHLMETVTASRTIEMTLYRGDGVLANEGGADVDGSAPTVGQHALVVIELNDSAEVFHSTDGTGNVDLNVAGPVDISVTRAVDINFNDAASFTRASDTAMDATVSMDALVGANLWAAQEVVATTSRWTSRAHFTVNGAEDTDTKHGNYARNDQGTIDTFGWSANLMSFVALAQNDDIGVSIQELSGGEDGGQYEINADTAGFWGINLNTMSNIATPNTKQLHFRWRDDTTDLNTGGGWLATEDNNTIGEVTKSDTYRLRIESANTGAAAESAARTYELQWGEKTGAACSSISTWTGLANTSDEFDMVATTHIDPDGEATTAGLLANTETYTRVNGEGRESADTTGSIGPLSASNFTELEYSFQATDDAVTGHTYCFRLYDTTAGSTLNGYSVYPEMTISFTDVSYSNTVMEWGTEASVGDDAWTTVNFAGTYDDAIFVCSAEYNANVGNESDGDADSVVCRVQNVGATSAQVRLQEPGTLVGAVGNLTDETIHWMVVEAGEYDNADIKMEAFKYTSTVTDGKSPVGWNGQQQTLVQSYTSPVVLGQVMTTNDTSHSAFWAHNGSQGAPTSASLYTGKHISEDTDTTRSNETVGVIVIEQANDTVSSVVYESRLQGQTIERIDDVHTNYTFNTSFSSTPSVAIISLAGVSGTDGPYPSLYGTSILSTTDIDLVNMETEIVDTEQTGNTEYVPYIVFESSGTYAVTANVALDQDTFRFYQNVDAIQPSTPLGNENTAITGVADTTVLRIRTAVQAGDLLEASALQFKLQYGQGATCSAIGSWSDVGGIGSGTIWRGYNNATPADGASITASLLNATTNALESYEEANNSVPNPTQVSDGSRGEWDWVVQNNGATASTDYCFRTTKSDGSVMEYTRYPKVTTAAAAGPTNTQLMRHGKWFNSSGVEQPFTF